MSGLDEDINVTLTRLENHKYRATYTPEKPGKSIQILSTYISDVKDTHYKNLASHITYR